MRSPSSTNSAKPRSFDILPDSVALLAGSLSEDGLTQCVVEPCLPALAVRADVVYQVGVEPDRRLGLGWGFFACRAVRR